MLQSSQTQQCMVFFSFLAQFYLASKSKNKGSCRSSRSSSLQRKFSSNACSHFMTQRRVTWQTNASQLIAGRLPMLSCKTIRLSQSLIKWLISSKSSLNLQSRTQRDPRNGDTLPQAKARSIIMLESSTLVASVT